MQDILRIRKELSEFIDLNSRNLTNEDVVKKALEAEQELLKITNK